MQTYLFFIIPNVVIPVKPLPPHFSLICDHNNVNEYSLKGIKPQYLVYDIRMVYRCCANSCQQKVNRPLAKGRGG